LFRCWPANRIIARRSLCLITSARRLLKAGLALARGS
jgi:hypothetical protein